MRERGGERERGVRKSDRWAETHTHTHTLPEEILIGLTLRLWGSPRLVLVLMSLCRKRWEVRVLYSVPKGPDGEQALRFSSLEILCVFASAFVTLWTYGVCTGPDWRRQLYPVFWRLIVWVSKSWLVSSVHLKTHSESEDASDLLQCLIYNCIIRITDILNRIVIICIVFWCVWMGEYGDVSE